MYVTYARPRQVIINTIAKFSGSRLILNGVVLEKYISNETRINTVYCVIGHKDVFCKVLKNYLRIKSGRKIKVSTQVLPSYVSVFIILLFGVR
jgi:hypothetical protein